MNTKVRSGSRCSIAAIILAVCMVFTQEALGADSKSASLNLAAGTSATQPFRIENGAVQPITNQQAQSANTPTTVPNGTLNLMDTSPLQRVDTVSRMRTEILEAIGPSDAAPQPSFSPASETRITTSTSSSPSTSTSDAASGTVSRPALPTASLLDVRRPEDTSGETEIRSGIVVTLNVRILEGPTFAPVGWAKLMALVDESDFEFVGLDKGPEGYLTASCFTFIVKGFHSESQIQDLIGKLEALSIVETAERVDLDALPSESEDTLREEAKLKALNLLREEWDFASSNEEFETVPEFNVNDPTFSMSARKETETYYEVKIHAYGQYFYFDYVYSDGEWHGSFTEDTLAETAVLNVLHAQGIHPSLVHLTMLYRNSVRPKQPQEGFREINAKVNFSTRTNMTWGFNVSLSNGSWEVTEIRVIDVQRQAEGRDAVKESAFRILMEHLTFTPSDPRGIGQRVTGVEEIVLETDQGTIPIGEEFHIGWALQRTRETRWYYDIYVYGMTFHFVGDRPYGTGNVNTWIEPESMALLAAASDLQSRGVPLWEMWVDGVKYVDQPPKGDEKLYRVQITAKSGEIYFYLIDSEAWTVSALEIKELGPASEFTDQEVPEIIIVPPRELTDEDLEGDSEEDLEEDPEKVLEDGERVVEGTLEDPPEVDPALSFASASSSYRPREPRLLIPSTRFAPSGSRFYPRT